MWMETLRAVIAPRIADLVSGDHGIETRQQLHQKFCEEHEVRMSYSTFAGWCEDLGVTFQKRIEVRIPGWKAMPRPEGFIGPMQAQPAARTTRADYRADPAGEQVDIDAPVEWDAAVPPLQIPVEAFNDNTPIILPGGLRAPVFIESRDFAN
jgi:hypothetical protein